MILRVQHTSSPAAGAGLVRGYGRYGGDVSSAYPDGVDTQVDPENSVINFANIRSLLAREGMDHVAEHLA
jgi:hypothetical protein